MMYYRNSVIDFYKGTDYHALRKGVPRPSEWHLPFYMYKLFLNKKDEFEPYIKETSIIIPLDYTDLKTLRSTLLHESIFSYYKAFYNYLAAKNLYSSGATHWIDITSYYAKLFLAGAITTLCGKRSYVINRDQKFFDINVYKTFNPTKEISEKSSYSLTLDFKLEERNGFIKFHKNRVNSHKDIWQNYTDIDIEGLGLTKITYEEMYDNDAMHLSKERNSENYTFEGYSQIDFNLNMGNFEKYFNRDDIKKEAELVYDDEVGIVLGVVQELYHLYTDFSINCLPIELEKLKHISSYMVDNQRLKEKLLNLIKEELPIDNEYLSEMNHYYSNN